MKHTLLKVLSFVVFLGMVFAAHSEAMMTGGGGGPMDSGMLQMPTAQQMFTYGATSAPLMGSDVTTTICLSGSVRSPWAEIHSLSM
jgi:hypothetical protein